MDIQCFIINLDPKLSDCFKKALETWIPGQAGDDINELIKILSGLSKKWGIDPKCHSRENGNPVISGGYGSPLSRG